MAQITTPAGISLEYETFGSPADPPILLVMGFTAQLITWPRGFCETLAAGGRHVIAFDNRDCGLSHKFDGVTVSIAAVTAAMAAGDHAEARRLVPYTLGEMADDGFGLLSALGIERAHVAGVSMGGMIAQRMAIDRPERVLSLTSMMSSTGEPEFGQSAPESLEGLLAPPPRDREGAIAAAQTWLLWRSKRYPDLDGARSIAAASYDRSRYPEGGSRQLAAVIADGSRAAALRRLQVPTLVIHGLDDTLIAPSGGERTAELIPGARLVLIPDMGHDRPKPLWGTICAPILEHTAAAGPGSAQAA